MLPEDDKRYAIETCRSSESALKWFKVNNFRLIHNIQLVHLLVMWYLVNLQNARCNNKDMKEGFHLTDKCAPTPVAARLSLGSAAARLLGLSFRIQQGAWISLSCECSVLSEFSESGSSLVQRSPTECDVSKCDREASTLRRSCRTKGTCAIGGRGGMRA